MAHSSEQLKKVYFFLLSFLTELEELQHSSLLLLKIEPSSVVKNVKRSWKETN